MRERPKGLVVNILTARNNPPVHRAVTMEHIYPPVLQAAKAIRPHRTYPLVRWGLFFYIEIKCYPDRMTKCRVNPNMAINAEERVCRTRGQHPAAPPLKPRLGLEGFPQRSLTQRGRAAVPTLYSVSLTGPKQVSTIVHNLPVFAQHGKHCHAPKTIKANDNGNLAIAA